MFSLLSTVRIIKSKQFSILINVHRMNLIVNRSLLPSGNYDLPHFFIRLPFPLFQKYLKMEDTGNRGVKNKKSCHFTAALFALRTIGILKIYIQTIIIRCG